MKANTKYVDISKRTTIMSRRNAGPFMEFFDHLLKVNIMMRAYVVSPGLRYKMALPSRNPQPNNTSYHVCMEDGGGNGGKLEGGKRTTKY